jgi:lipoprotein-anchoring transpeptidase ErfK/SrfK
MVLTLGAWWGLEFFRAPRAPGLPEETAKVPGEVLAAQRPEPVISRFKMTDFPHLPLSPSPPPLSLDVSDGEYWIRIDKGGYKLYLYRGFDVEKIYDVAVGKNPGDKERPGDNKTPIGTFKVQSIEDARGWTHDFRDGKGVIKGAYGPWFIRLRTRWKGIGIHGTHDPDSLGSMVSEGCVRMLNSELEELKRFASLNMKVVIEE